MSANAEPDEAPVFVVVRAAGGLEVHELRQGVTMTLGSGERCHIQVEDAEVASEHLRLTWDKDVVRLNPLQPLHVNGKPSEGVVSLGPGDDVAIGSTLFVVGIPTAIRAIGRRTLTHHEFRERVYEELARAQRGQRSTALVMVHIGQGVARSFADEALQLLRAGDLMGIYAPDILQFLLPDTEGGAARSVFERLLGRLVPGTGVNVGIAVSPDDADHPERLMWAAEQALNAAMLDEARFSTPPVGEPPATAADVLVEAVDEIPGDARTVLVQGETSTGRSLVAHLISERRAPSGPEVVLLCAELTDDDKANRAFGPGGRARAAAGGALILDELGELPVCAQAPLLETLNALDAHKAETTVVSTSQRALMGLVERGALDGALLERLSQAQVELPPLRTRMSDIVPLANRFAIEASGNEPKWSPGAIAALRSYPWPGNVLELKNTMRRAMRLAGRSGEILREHLPTDPMPLASTPGRLREHVDGVERDAIIKALADSNHNQTHAAKRLGVSRRALIYKMEKYGLKRPPKGSRKT